jgi:hypothetical protein
MKLDEMTMKVGNLSYNLSRYFAKASKEIEQFKHVGDIEDQFKVLNRDSEFLLTSNDVPCAYFFVKHDDALTEISVAYVEESFRKQGVFAKFIWFLKRFFSADKITLSDVHSSDTVEALKKLKNRFSIFWEKDNKREKYDPNNTEKYYSDSKPTGWKVVLENDGDFSNWPRFFDLNRPDIRQHYDWLIE